MLRRAAENTFSVRWVGGRVGVEVEAPKVPQMSTTRELKKLNSALDGTAWKVPKESKSV